MFQSKVGPTQVWKLIWLFLHICYTSQRLVRLVTFPTKSNEYRYRLQPSTARMLSLSSFWLLDIKVTFVFLDIIYQTWERVFHHIFKDWEESWKYDAQWSIFDELWRVWKCDETYFGVFDVSSQSKIKIQRNEIVKIYANYLIFFV